MYHLENAIRSINAMKKEIEESKQWITMKQSISLTKLNEKISELQRTKEYALKNLKTKKRF